MKELQQLNNSLLDMDKEAIQNLIKSQVELIESGEIDPIKAFIFSHKLLEFAKQLQENLKTHVSGISGEFNGLRLSEVKTGSKFDYSNCNHHYLNELYQQLEAIKLEIKNEENFLKQINTSIEVVDRETGETHELKAPINTFSISTKVEWI